MRTKQKINVEELTVSEAKDLAQQLARMFPSGAACVPADSLDQNNGYWEIGKPYFIRTVTNFYTGRLVSVTPLELVLSEAAWIADTGRFTQALEKENFNEVELYPLTAKVIIGRGSIIDAVVVSKIQASQK